MQNERMEKPDPSVHHSLDVKPAALQWRDLYIAGRPGYSIISVSPREANADVGARELKKECHLRDPFTQVEVQPDGQIMENTSKIFQDIRVQLHNDCTASTFSRRILCPKMRLCVLPLTNARKLKHFMRD